MRSPSIAPCRSSARARRYRSDRAGLGLRYPIQGKTVLVTGGAGGIGRTTATQLHRRGANVIICDLNQEAVEAVAAGLGAGRALARRRRRHRSRRDAVGGGRGGRAVRGTGWEPAGRSAVNQRRDGQSRHAGVTDFGPVSPRPPSCTAGGYVARTVAGTRANI